MTQRIILQTFFYLWKVGMHFRQIVAYVILDIATKKLFSFYHLSICLSLDSLLKNDMTEFVDTLCHKKY